MLSMTKDKILNPRRPWKNPDGTFNKNQPIPLNFAVQNEDYSVPPYVPFVGVNPRDVLSYSIDLAEVRGFVSSEMILESTSLVFAFGLDLFFTPVRPSKEWDMLGESFNFFLLFCSMGSVVVFVGITHYLMKRKQLMQRWK